MFEGLIVGGMADVEKVFWPEDGLTQSGQGHMSRSQGAAWVIFSWSHGGVLCSGAVVAARSGSAAVAAAAAAEDAWYVGLGVAWRNVAVVVNPARKRTWTFGLAMEGQRNLAALELWRKVRPRLAMTDRTSAMVSLDLVFEKWKTMSKISERKGKAETKTKEKAQDWE
jgi:hypothetical protein